MTTRRGNGAAFAHRHPVQNLTSRQSLFADAQQSHGPDYPAMTGDTIFSPAAEFADNRLSPEHYVAPPPYEETKYAGRATADNYQTRRRSHQYYSPTMPVQ